jgi:hypothetical protein
MGLGKMQARPEFLKTLARLIDPMPGRSAQRDEMRPVPRLAGLLPSAVTNNVSANNCADQKPFVHTSGFVVALEFRNFPHYGPGG